MKKHAKRVYGVMDALVRVMKESKRPYYTIPEIVELVQKVVAGKTRTIEVMATRDCIKRNILFKTDFKIKSEKNWRTIYAACGTEVNIEMLQPLYKAIRTKPATKRKVREAL
ncbi:MAG: hypothetical protein KAJ55_06550, partial [Anaerolineales bacterium]|nr:hypothetical protein [Anaerolineales bacterium]